MGGETGLAAKWARNWERKLGKPKCPMCGSERLEPITVLACLDCGWGRRASR